MTQGSRIALVVIVLLVTAGCDHATKAMARNALAGELPLSVVANTVRFELVTNPGAFLSLGAALPEAARHALFLIAIPVLLAGVCTLAIRSGLRTPTALVGLGFVAGGGLANWFDRVLHDGHVTDFVSIGIGPLRTGIFNLADVMIFAGVGLILLASRRVDAEAQAENAAHLSGLSPADAAVFASKLLLAPALIAAVSIAGQRLGARLAGSLTALPVVAGPIAFFVALEQGPAFGSRAARGALAGELSLAAFCLVYGYACLRWPWFVCLPLALAGFALGTLALDAAGPSLAFATAAGVAVPLGVPGLLPDPAPSGERGAITPGELVVRMIAGASLVVAVTAAASALGPGLAGLLTPFPIAASVLTVFSHRGQGGAFAVQLLRGLCRGLLGMTGFFLVLAAALEPLGVVPAFALACAAALAVQAVLVARLRREVP